MKRRTRSKLDRPYRTQMSRGKIRKHLHLIRCNICCRHCRICNLCNYFRRTARSQQHKRNKKRQSRERNGHGSINIPSEAQRHNNTPSPLRFSAKPQSAQENGERYKHRGFPVGEDEFAEHDATKEHVPATRLRAMNCSSVAYDRNR